MRFYKPINDPVPVDVIEAVYSGEYADGTAAIFYLSGAERDIVEKQMAVIETGLRQKRVEKAIELTGERPGANSAKLMFGEKSNLELLAMLGIWLLRVEQDDPEAWKQMLSASNIAPT